MPFDRTSGASRRLHCILAALIDTHCHIDLPPFDADRADTIARALAAGVTGMLVPGVRPATWPALIALARSTEAQSALRIAIGVHPQVVPELGADELPSADDVVDAIVRAATDAGPICVAVGECGLDGGTAERDRQDQLFRAHIRAARTLELPLVVHVLRAHDAAPRILRDERAADVGGVLHSYSGGQSLISVYRDLGFAFSFAGPVTYPNARKPVAAARAIPAELLLVETDAPDQAPAAHRGHRSEPAYLPTIIEGIAAARGETREDVAAYTTRNARRIFDWGSFAT